MMTINKKYHVVILEMSNSIDKDTLHEALCELIHEDTTHPLLDQADTYVANITVLDGFNVDKEGTIDND